MSDAKFLANENVPGDAVQAARQEGIDLAWVKEIAAGADDDTVLAMSVAENRVLVTFDKDFGEIAFRQGRDATCGIILLRPQATTAFGDLPGPLSYVCSEPTNRLDKPFRCRTGKQYSGYSPAIVHQSFACKPLRRQTRPVPSDRQRYSGRRCGSPILARTWGETGCGPRAQVRITACRFWDGRWPESDTDDRRSPG